MDQILKLDFLTEINYLRLFFGIFLLFIFSKVIELVYKKYSYSDDNKLLFTKHMFPFLIAMFLIVSVIKTSIALSLGLVGALSIIRFRTAIKESGQLITLLVLTSLSISMAAEKEILGFIITLIYSVNTIINSKELKKVSFSSKKKFLRVYLKDEEINIDLLTDINTFERLYKDVNKKIVVEFSLNETDNSADKVLKKLKEYAGVNSFEIF